MTKNTSLGAPICSTSLELHQYSNPYPDPTSDITYHPDNMTFPIAPITTGQSDIAATVRPLKGIDLYYVSSISGILCSKKPNIMASFIPHSLKNMKCHEVFCSKTSMKHYMNDAMVRHFILLENSISTRNRKFLHFFGIAVQLAVFEDMKPHCQVLSQ
jgi:hypothetical protein